ncbi:MAG: hypothetical protein LC772_12570, partial [Chloroflexi bacterium]|nr:hypothetical protein [Chloroflexota bacterium]
MYSALLPAHHAPSLSEPSTALFLARRPAAALLALIILAGLICPAAGIASAAGNPPTQGNLLPQGSFENPNVDTGWADGFNIPNTQEFQVVTEDGKHWLRIENHDPNRQLDTVHAYVRVPPNVLSLTVSLRMKASHLKVGAEGWHDARVALVFEGGSFGYPARVPELRADSEGVSESVDLAVPKGAT